MRNAIPWLVLVAAFVAGTAFVGWWAVPIVGAVYGLVATDGMPWLLTSLAASTAWALLLLLAAATQGPVLELAGVVSGVFGLPGFAFIVLTLSFAALLAGSAGELAAVLGRSVYRPERADER